MIPTIALTVSLLSLALSIISLVRRNLPGKTGPQGPQGERGPQGMPGPQAQPILGQSSAICNACGKHVARFSLTTAGLICANCNPEK